MYVPFLLQIDSDSELSRRTNLTKRCKIDHLLKDIASGRWTANTLAQYNDFDVIIGYSPMMKNTGALMPHVYNLLTGVYRTS